MVVLKRFWWPALAAFSLAGAPADACSVSSDYVRPSNFELVQIADAIVVATAVEQTGGKDDQGVLFQVESSVKGAGPASFTSGFAGIGPAGPSSSGDLSRAHPEAYHGPCTRRTFRRGSRYLLFLDKAGDGSWRQLGFPFARVNEDYSGEEDEWIRAVRRYARLQQRLGPMEQLAALEAMLETKRDPEGAALPPAALNDINAHLSLPSPWKPTPYLLEAWKMVERGQVPEFGLRSPAATEGGEIEALTDFVTGRPPRDGDPTIGEMRRFLLSALVTGDHADAAPIFDAILAAPAPDPDALGLSLRFFAKHGQYPRAFQWIETRLMSILPTLSRNEAFKLIGAAITAQNGESHEGPAPWLGDAHAAAVWPELALGLYWYANNVLGEDLSYRLGDAIGRIPRTDYRQRPLLTLALARAYAPGVAEWALAELNDDSKRQKWEEAVGYRQPISVSPAYLPMRVILLASLDDRESRMIRIFCQSAERRRMLIAMLGAHGGILETGFLARIAATPSLNKEERELLAGAIIQFQVRAAERDGELLHWHLAEYARSMTNGREPLEERDARPIVCPA